jgi:hypothetical protein
VSVNKALAHKEKLHRYKVWLLAEGQTADVPRALPKLCYPSKPISKLSDLETLLLVYNYGRPIEMAVEATCTLPNGESASYTTRKISSEAVDFVYNEPGLYTPGTPRQRMAVGTAMSLHLDGLGLGDLEGLLTSQTEDGFQVAIRKDCRSILAGKLAQIAAENGIGVEATDTVRTNAPRLEPEHTACWFTDYRGKLKKGKIVSLSQFDALIRIAPTMIPPNGTRIVFRGPEWHGAEVAIAFEIGFIAKFCVPIPAEKFSPALRFSGA